MTFEVGIRNAGLGLLLVFTFFGGLGGMALVAGWWGIWDIIAGLVVATCWAASRATRRTRTEPEVARHEGVLVTGGSGFLGTLAWSRGLRRRRGLERRRAPTSRVPGDVRRRRRRRPRRHGRTRRGRRRRGRRSDTASTWSSTSPRSSPRARTRPRARVRASTSTAPGNVLDACLAPRRAPHRGLLERRGVRLPRRQPRVAHRGRRRSAATRSSPTADHKRLVEEMLAALPRDASRARAGGAAHRHDPRRAASTTRSPRCSTAAAAARSAARESPVRVHLGHRRRRRSSQRAVTGAVTGVFNVAGDGAMTVDEIAARARQADADACPSRCSRARSRVGQAARRSRRTAGADEVPPVPPGARQHPPEGGLRLHAVEDPRRGVRGVAVAKVH